MKKLRIGVYLDIEFKPQIGGAFSYSELLFEKINLFKFDDKIEILFISKHNIDSSLFEKPFIQIPEVKFLKNRWTLKLKLLCKLFSLVVLKHLKIHERIKNKIEKKVLLDTSGFLLQNKIDLLYYLTPNLSPFHYPFIITHWDLGHKTMFVYQEVFNNTKFEKREFYHRVTLQKAFAIFVESEQSKKELAIYESINPQRVFVVPLFPGKVVEMQVEDNEQLTILKQWQLLPNSFYFYPAQFWAHKNHFGLVMAFKVVVEKYPHFKLVLSGADNGNMDYIKEIVQNEQLENNVIFTGFVSNEAIHSFYKNAIAMVMPTLLGPTNMPLLEAYYLGCPVLCSDLEGHKQQMGDKAVYFNPLNHDDIADKMIAVLTQNKVEIVKSNIDIPALLNQHFLTLYNARKTFR